MPVEGYKSITISETVYIKLGKYAQKTNRTVPQVIECLLEKAEKSQKRTEKKTHHPTPQADRNSIPLGNGFDALLKAVWCPICGGKLTVQQKNGEKALVCSQHGEMKVLLDKDPKIGGEGDV